MDMENKEQIYRNIYPQIESICAYETDEVAKMANVISILGEALPYFWIGFYRVIGNELVLGPFKGPVACTRIPFGKGVCGCAWKEEKTLVVPDVHQFPGHIACSSASNSEIVVPIWNGGKVVGEIDIDSTEFDEFDSIDAFWLEQIGACVSMHVNPDLRDYVESKILPRYKDFDLAHRKDHAQYVIGQSMVFAGHYDVSPDMCYAVAAFHDTGLCEGRETHHTVSARIIREDARLKEWFTPEQIDVMADAAEDHRASSKNGPRTIYGCIVAEADRQIDGETIIRRTVQYGLGHYPELDKEAHFQRLLAHMAAKYAEGGYLKLWIPFGNNSVKLKEFQSVLKNEPDIIRAMFEEAWKKQTEGC